MRITPRLHDRTRNLPAFHPLDISLCNIHASDETYFSVDDADLTVVAIVHLTGKCRKLHWHESMHLHAVLAKHFEETVRGLPAAHIVIDQPHLHPLPGFFHQRIGHQTAQRVIGKDVSVQVDVVSGLCYRLQQGWKKLITVRVDFRFSTEKRQSGTLLIKQIDEGALVFRHIHVLQHVGISQHRPLRELIHALL